MVKFVTATKFGDLPGPVVHETKRVLLDSIGCALGGIATEKGKFSIELARRLGGVPESSILGIGDRTSCATAAFANGELINALDMDAILLPPGHIAPFVIPPPLALAESVDASGEDIISAVAIAHEISVRLAKALNLSPGVFNTEGEFIYAPVEGYGQAIFGGAAAAGRVLKLNEEKMSSALGIAGHICPVPTFMKWARTVPSTLTKYQSAGWVSQGGVTAALLADTGYYGDASVLDGDYAFWRFFGAEKWDPEHLTDQLGERWHFLATQYKPYPCCRIIHASLDCFTKIMDENNIAADDMDRVEVRLGILSDLPLWKNRKITNEVDAQFSIPYVFAVAAHRIKRGPDWQSQANMTNPQLLKFMDKVSAQWHPETAKVRQESLKLIKEDPRAATVSLASVKVEAGGKAYEEETKYPKGVNSPEQFRTTDEELIRKFTSNASYILPVAKIDRAIQLIMELEKEEAVSKVMENLKL